MVELEGVKYSIIIPLFNRPDEIRELCESLVKQSFQNFELIIVEDGSSISSKTVIDGFFGQLNIQYHLKQNEGPGLTRNYGAKFAKSNYLIFFDSDCIIPLDYMLNLDHFLSHHREIDCFGGPDVAHPSFTDVQKAISYSMTAFLTTGGIRGGKKGVDKFHPRSFNMGFKTSIFEKLGGYSSMRFGEDLDMSLRLHFGGYKTALIPECFVYHKRRTDFRKFFKQIHNSGIARINLYKRYPKSLKIPHLLPAAFVIFTIFSLFLLFIPVYLGILVLSFYSLLILFDSAAKNKSLKIGFLSLISTYVQHFAYGTGFLKAVWVRLVLKKEEFHSFGKNFYK